MLTKLLIMFKLTFLFLIISFYVSAQVVPFGTVIIGKRLPTLNTNIISFPFVSLATLKGSIKINDSKLTIVENGFVVLPFSDTRIPDINNASKYLVGSGKEDFEITIHDFTPNTNFKARSYAKNSKGEVIYSKLFNFTTSISPCDTYPAPCKGGGFCTFDLENLIIYCNCTPTNCGDCCAQGVNDNDPLCTSGTNYCNAYWYAKNMPKIKLMKTQDNMVINYSWYIPEGLSIKNPNTGISK